MEIEQLKLSSTQKQQITNMLQNQGLSQSDINEILNGNYSTFQNEADLADVFSSSGNHQKVLQGLADGYTMEELPQIGVNQSEIQGFMDTINSYNISVENAKAINQYSNGSNMILSVKRGTITRTELQSGIMQDLSIKLQERGMSQSQIYEISNVIQQLNYDKPVHNNYDIINSHMQEMNLPRACSPSVCKAVKDMNSFEHIDETISSLDEGLSKARLPQSMKLYRAIKTNGQVDMQNYVGKSMNNKGYTSTSPLYDSSFAKYDEYDTVMEIYAPKGTQGAYITQLSDYDSVEQEVLLNPNDIYVVGAQSGVIDKNGKSKTVLQGLLLSKERECYKDVGQQATEQRSNSYEKSFSTQAESDNLYDQTIQQQTYSQNGNLENLPARQNRFSRFFNQIRSRFSRGRNDGTQDTTYQDRQQQNTKTKTVEKKPWELEPEEKARIQRESAEIARRHREQQEQQSQQTQTQQQNQEQGNAKMIQGQVQQQPIVDMGGMEL